MKTVRQWAGAMAGIALAAMGGMMFVSGAGIVAPFVFWSGIGIAVWRGIAAWQAREDPYDLRRLWEYEPETEEPGDEFHEGANSIYCHQCGVAVAERTTRCPECGFRLM